MVESPESIVNIDGHYYYPGRAGSYLIIAGDEAAFVDNNTRFSVPNMMQTLEREGLSPDQVRYCIVTHVHLDHSGGTAELMKHCPNATVLCHPKASPHIIDPSKLVAGARVVYGDIFDELYGEIEAVAEERVQSMDDGTTAELGERTLTFYDTPGHARHHVCIHDSQTNTLFSGDAFGLMYQQLQGGKHPYMNYVCAPPTFEPTKAKASIERILALAPDHIGLTHFGFCTAHEEGAAMLIRNIDDAEQVSIKAAELGLQGDALQQFCDEGVLAYIKKELAYCGLDIHDDAVNQWAVNENQVTSQGCAVLATRLQKA